MDYCYFDRRKNLPLFCLFVLFCFKVPRVRDECLHVFRFYDWCCPSSLMNRCIIISVSYMVLGEKKIYILLNICLTFQNKD